MSEKLRAHPQNPFPEPSGAQQGQGQVGDISNEAWIEFLYLILTRCPQYKTVREGELAKPTEKWTGKIAEKPLDEDTKNMIHKIKRELDQCKLVLEKAEKSQWFHPDRFSNIIKKSKPIKNAVCLALGGGWIDTDDFANGKAFLWQYAFFTRICELIESEQGMETGTLPRVFQDPSFELQEIYLLEKVMEQKVVRDPAAQKLVDEHTFLFTPHGTWPVVADLLFDGRPFPKLYIGNSMQDPNGGVDGAIAQKYIHEYYTLNLTPEPSQGVLTMRSRAQLFENTYRKDILVKGHHDNHESKHRFLGEYVYWKEQATQSTASSVSSWNAFADRNRRANPKGTGASRTSR